MVNAEKKLRELLNCLVQEQFTKGSYVKIKPITSGGANCTSDLFEVTISCSKHTQELFAKVASTGHLVNESKLMFDTEIFVLSNISKVFEKIQDEHGITEKFTFPKFYKSAEGIIVMENLTCKGYECYDRFKIMDWQYASKCVEALARFHALSLAFKKEYPAEFKSAGDLLEKPLTLFTGSHWEGITDAAMAAVYEEDREKLSQLLKGTDGLSKALDLSEPRNTAVIAHCDYRASNMMHKEVDGEYHVIPIDYQTARLGCPVADLLNFILMGSDQQFRKQYFHQLIDHYYEQLTLMMTKLGMQPEEVYGRKEFESDLKAKLPISLSFAAVALPFVTADAASAPNFERGQFVPRASQLFVERFRELMQDFKDWGVI